MFGAGSAISLKSSLVASAKAKQDSQHQLKSKYCNKQKDKLKAASFSAGGKSREIKVITVTTSDDHRYIKVPYSDQL